MEFLELRRRVLDARLSFKSRPHIWHHCIEQVNDGDVCLEFGVFNGRSINYMAEARPDSQFHGFDSFEGLPENWIPGREAGFFKTDQSKLRFHPNIAIHRGWFSDTLPPFVAALKTPVKFMHFDCDLGVSTNTVLTALQSVIVDSKSLLLFDEFYNYNGYEDHEIASFLEFVNRTGANFEVVGRNINHQQVAIQIL